MPTFLVAHSDPHNSYALIRSCAVCPSLPLSRAHSTAMSIPNGIGAAAVGAWGTLRGHAVAGVVLLAGRQAGLLGSTWALVCP